jgi:uncharacterized phosphosugar-binding protein
MMLLVAVLTHLQAMYYKNKQLSKQKLASKLAESTDVIQHNNTAKPEAKTVATANATTTTTSAHDAATPSTYT